MILAHTPFPGLTQDNTDGLEDAMKDFVSSRDLPLYQMMAFHLGWVDQQGEPEVSPPQDRSFGQLVLSVAIALGGNAEDALPYAVAIELARNFMLVHEDVQNANTERGDRPTIWWSWGPAQAINTGDGMHALARMAIFDQMERESPASDAKLVSEAVRTLDEAVLQVCEGDFLEISYQERANVTVPQILEVATKQGRLLGAAARLGGLAACIDDSKLSVLEDFGSTLGKALILASDHRALWASNDTERSEAERGRLQSKTKSVSVAHAVENTDPSTRRQIGELFMKRVLDPTDVAQVVELLSKTDSREFSAKLISDLLKEGHQALESTGVSTEFSESVSGWITEKVSIE